MVCVYVRARIFLCLSQLCVCVCVCVFGCVEVSIYVVSECVCMYMYMRVRYSELLGPDPFCSSNLRPANARTLPHL